MQLNLKQLLLLIRSSSHPLLITGNLFRRLRGCFLNGNMFLIERDGLSLRDNYFGVISWGRSFWSCVLCEEFIIWLRRLTIQVDVIYFNIYLVSNRVHPARPFLLLFTKVTCLRFLALTIRVNCVGGNLKLGLVFFLDYIVCCSEIAPLIGHVWSLQKAGSHCLGVLYLALLLFFLHIQDEYSLDCTLATLILYQRFVILVSVHFLGWFWIRPTFLPLIVEAVLKAIYFLICFSFSWILLPPLHIMLFNGV